MSTVRYRTVETPDSIIVLVDDGGIAEIREVGESDEGDGRQTTIEYYQSRFTASDLLSGTSIWEIVGNGKMHYDDFTTEYTDPEHVITALEWLAVGCEYIEDNTIWENFHS